MSLFVSPHTLEYPREASRWVLNVYIFSTSFHVRVYLSVKFWTFDCSTSPVGLFRFSPQRGLHNVRCSRITESRPRMFQFALPRVLLPLKQDAPPLVVPLFKLPNTRRKAGTPRITLCNPIYQILVIIITERKRECPLARYADNSPRFPFGERRPRMSQPALPRA